MPRKAQTAPEQEKDEKAVDAPANEKKEQEDEKKASQTAPEQEKKVYTFTSSNPFLSCVGLGVQFINGKASTTNLEVARVLATLDGVELVEE